MSHPEFRMIRHPLVLRQLQVVQVTRLSPHLQRVVLAGPALEGFISSAPDDHIKLFFANRHGQWVLPELGPDGATWPAELEPSPSRDFTPRAYDPERQELTIDFVLHGEGPATRWAAQAEVGQSLPIAGPRGSAVLEGMAPDGLIMVGDETALPAIARWLEEAAADTAIQVFLEIPEAADQLPLQHGPKVQLHWLPRHGQAAGQLLRQTVAALPVAGDRQLIWIACDSSTARQIRLDLDQRGIPKELIKAKGYWTPEASI